LYIEDNDGDDDGKALHKYNGGIKEASYFNRGAQSSLTADELAQAKLKQSKVNKCKKIIREILLNFIFVGILFTVIYSSRNVRAHLYKQQISTTFSGYQDIKSMNDLYTWLSEDFLTNLKADESIYNSSVRPTYSNIGSYLMDASSYLLGYPILRQLRIRNSN
jgi:hypothetical protein